MAKSCTTIANLRLFHDSPSSLRILWSAVVISPNLVALGMWLFRLRLQGALVIFVRLQISQLCVNRLCFPSDLLEGRRSGRGGSGGSVVSHPEDVDLVSTNLFVNSSSHPGKSCNRFLNACVVSRSHGAYSLVLSAGSPSVPEMLAPHDKPGTTIGTKLSHLQSNILQCLTRFGV